MDYKTGERRVVLAIGNALTALASTFHSTTRRELGKATQPLTVMIIPDSAGKITAFKITYVMIIFLSLILLGLASLSFALWEGATRGAPERTRLMSAAAATERELELVTDEVIRTVRTWRDFSAAMASLRVAAGFSVSGGSISRGRSEAGSVGDLRALGSYFSQATVFATELSDVLSMELDLLGDIPTLWPVSRGAGWITSLFGVERHPFNSGFRLHNGLDIAWYSGTAVLVAARGTVESVGFEPNGLGNFVRVRHRYGFRTVYGHLREFTVAPGQILERGQMIGGIGNTGLSTGPHLHYEIWIGTQIVDPTYYLEIDTSLLR